MCNGKAVFLCLMDSQSTLMLRNNLLRHRQGFERRIKDCVITKREIVFFFRKTIARMSVCFTFKSIEKFVSF